jgi:hypothetical protein
VRKRSIKVLASLTAAFPKGAIVDALIDTKALTKGELERLVEELKSAADTGTPPPRPARRKAGQGDDSPTSRIKRVLTVEAGLSEQRSIQELRAELAGTLSVALPSARGASLDQWLEATLGAVPPGEVLNAALSIANRSNR